MLGLSRLVEKRFYIIGLLPAVLALLVLTALPMGYLVYLSLSRWDPGMAAPRFTGISNFLRILTQDKMFWHGFRTSLIYVGAVVSAEFVLGFTMALLVNRDLGKMWSSWNFLLRSSPGYSTDSTENVR